MRSQSLNEFGSRVDWFKNDKFLRDLEGDSVDTEILDEELRSLQEEDHTSCRGKTVRFLESNPLQIVLCVLVLVDAGIVVAEILLDLHAIRGQYTEAESSLRNCLSFLKARYAHDLADYNGQDIDVILEILRQQYPSNETAVEYDHSASDGNHHRKRHVPNSESRDQPIAASTAHRHSMQSEARPLDPDGRRFGMDAGVVMESDDRQPTSSTDADQIRRRSQEVKQRQRPVRPSEAARSASGSASGSATDDDRRSVSASPPPPPPAPQSAQLPSAQGSHDRDHLTPRVQSMHGQRSEGQTTSGEHHSSSSASSSDSSYSSSLVGRHRHRSRDALRQSELTASARMLLPPGGATSRWLGRRQEGHVPLRRVRRDSDDDGEDQDVGEDGDGSAHSDGSFHDVTSSHGDVSRDRANDSMNGSRIDYGKDKTRTKTKLLLKIAHILHYISIAILGVFVIQVILKVIGMGADFFRKKMEVFDAVIIVASFLLDIVFLEGIGPGGLDKGAALVIIFLLWRLLRVINGIMVTAKQRQEFRIKLQKRARRRAEKKIEALEEEKHFKEKEISNLQSLCEAKGATEQEINFCKPRRRNLAQKNTSAGLSSIASLSLGFTMSMHMSGGAGFMNNATAGGVDGRRFSSLTGDAFPGLPMLMPGVGRGAPRRASSVSGKPTSDGKKQLTADMTLVEEPAMEGAAEEEAGDGEAVDNGKVKEQEGGEGIADLKAARRGSGDDFDDVSGPAADGLATQRPEANGDAVQFHIGDVSSDGEDAADAGSGDHTSSKPDISDASQSRDPEPVGHVPPRTAVVAIEIPNGPVAVATTSPLETNTDHVTWYSRPKADSESAEATSSGSEQNGLLRESEMTSTSSSTSTPSDPKKPSHGKDERRSPSPI